MRQWWLSAVVILLLAGSVQAGNRQPPLFKITPLRDGRYLLEPLAGVSMATRPRVNLQPNPNLPASMPGGGQNLYPETRAGKAAAGHPGD